MKVIFGIIAATVLAVIVGSYLTASVDVATAPSRVLSDSVKTGNIVGNYEAFFDMKAGYETRIAEIKSLKTQLDDSTGSDRRYAQTDLNGVRQTCRSLAQRYNADSLKLNRGAFKSNGLPETLDAQACEA